MHTLEETRDLIRKGEMSVRGVEMDQVPQVSLRIVEGGAPNRSFIDRSRLC